MQNFTHSFLPTKLSHLIKSSIIFTREIVQPFRSMSAQTTCEWPVATISCIEEGLRPYRHKTITSKAPEIPNVIDTLRLFHRLCRVASLSPLGRTRSATHATATKKWRRICTSAIKQRGEKRCSLRTQELKRLRAIGVADLWILILENQTRFGSPDVSDRNKTFRAWIARCAAASVNDSGNIVHETVERLLLVPVRQILASNSPKHYDPGSPAGMFPEMSNTLMQLQSEEPQFYDCINMAFTHFVRMAFTGLDIYTYYRQRVSDPEPCRCKLDYMIEHYIKANQYDYDATMNFPVYFTELIMNVNMRGTFDFLFTHIFPMLYRKGSMDLLGFRLYSWITAAAMHQLIDSKNSPMTALSAAHRPDNVEPLQRLAFRPIGALPRIEMAGVHMFRVREEMQLHGDEPRDLQMIPCGAMIDIEDYVSPVETDSKESDDESNNDSAEEENDEEDEEQMCVICQESTLEEGELFVELDVCGHAFHGDCIATWMNSRTTVVTCPMCREGICEARATRLGCEFCEC